MSYVRIAQKTSRHATLLVLTRPQPQTAHRFISPKTRTSPSYGSMTSHSLALIPRPPSPFPSLSFSKPQTSLTTCSKTFPYSSTPFAPTSVKSLLLPSTTTYGTLSTPFPACSLIALLTSINPSDASSTSVLASASDSPAAAQAATTVSFALGCRLCVKYWAYSAVLGVSP